MVKLSSAFAGIFGQAFAGIFLACFGQAVAANFLAYFGRAFVGECWCHLCNQLPICRYAPPHMRTFCQLVGPTCADIYADTYAVLHVIALRVILASDGRIYGRIVVFVKSALCGWLILTKPVACKVPSA